MAVIYCFLCRECGSWVDTTTREPAPICHGDMRRDYQREGVGFNGLAEMKRQREQGLDGLSGRKAQRDLFLPTADDMRSPSDPTGQKGLREWAERHGPRETNKKPLYPEMEKKVY